MAKEKLEKTNAIRILEREKVYLSAPQLASSDKREYRCRTGTGTRAAAGTGI